MAALTLVARFILACTFALSGVSKLAAPRTREGLIEFGIPAIVATPLGIALVVAEIAAAILILTPATALSGTVVALILLAAFGIAIALNLVRGRRPACNCFGQLHSAPIGWSTLARNAILAGIAVFALYRGHNGAADAGGWIRSLTLADRAELAEGVLGLILAIGILALLVQIVRQQGRMLLRFDRIDESLRTAKPVPTPREAPQMGLPIGAPAPAFELDELDADRTSLGNLLRPGIPALLIFSNPNCGPCQALMPEIARWQLEHAAVVTIALVSEGTAKENRAKSSAHGLPRVLLQARREVAELYKAYGTPSAVLVNPNGAIGSSVAGGVDSIHTLVSQVLARPRPVSQMGHVAPALVFDDIHGRSVGLKDLHGTALLLLFWDPGCGFCQRMLDDLRLWEASPQLKALRLLVVSTGSLEENCALNLQSLVVIDRDSLARSAFRASGTPTAVRLDAQGRIASELAVGAQAVMALAYGTSGAKAPPSRESPSSTPGSQRSGRTTFLCQGE